jgi:hypothetical protein
MKAEQGCNHQVGTVVAEPVQVGVPLTFRQQHTVRVFALGVAAQGIWPKVRFVVPCVSHGDDMAPTGPKGAAVLCPAARHP